MLNLAEHLLAAGVPSGLCLPCAVGILESLWHFTAEFAPRGDIGRYTNKRIAAGCGWERNPDVLIQALHDAHWIDTDTTHRLIIHDWHEHADNTTRKRLVRAHECFVGVAEKVTVKRQTKLATEDKGGCLPIPIPIPKANTNTIPPPDSQDGFDFPAWFEALYALAPKKGFKHQARGAMATDTRITDPTFRGKVEAAWKLWAEYMGVEYHPKRTLLEWWNDEGWKDEIPKSVSKLDYQLDHMEAT
jgi:hypothetical protein